MSITNTSRFHNLDYYKNDNLDCYTNPTISKVINITTNCDPARLYIDLFSTLYDGLLYNDTIHSKLDNFNSSNENIQNKTIELLNNFDHELQQEIIADYGCTPKNNKCDELHRAYVRCVCEMKEIIDWKDDDKWLCDSQNVAKVYDYKGYSSASYYNYSALFNKHFVEPYQLRKITNTDCVKQIIIACDNADSVDIHHDTFNEYNNEFDEQNDTINEINATDSILTKQNDLIDSIETNDIVNRSIHSNETNETNQSTDKPTNTTNLTNTTNQSNQPETKSTHRSNVIDTLNKLQEHYMSASSSSSLLVDPDDIESSINPIVRNILLEYKTELLKINPSIDFKIIIPQTRSYVAVMRGLAFQHINTNWMISTDDDDINISLNELSKLFRAFVIPPKQIYNFATLSIWMKPYRVCQLAGIENNSVCLMPRIINVDFVKDLDLSNSCRLTTFEDNEIRTNELLKTNLLDLNIVHENEDVNDMRDEDSVIYTLQTPAYIYKEPSFRGCRANSELALRMCCWIDIMSFFFDNDWDMESAKKIQLDKWLLSMFISTYHYRHKVVKLHEKYNIIEQDRRKMFEWMEKSNKFIRENVQSTYMNPDGLSKYVLFEWKDDVLIANDCVKFNGWRRFRKAKVFGDSVIYDGRTYGFDEWNEMVDNSKCRVVY